MTAIATRTSLDRLAIWAGLLGSTIILVGSSVTAVAYSGSNGGPYSPLDHFVSELGEVGVSELAPVFNAGLNIGWLLIVGILVWVSLTAVTWRRATR